jgi:hypothetical protein
MLHPGLRLAVNTFAWIFETIAYLVLVWTGCALSMYGNDPFFGSLIRWTKSFAPYLVLSSAALTVLARAGRWSVREKSALERMIDRLIGDDLGKFRKDCFPGLPENEPRHNNRVTIFKHVQWKWRIRPWRNMTWPWGWPRLPGSGWLVIAHRSGHTTQSSTTVFLAPDDAVHAEGVAGRAWSSDGAIRVSGLPDLSQVQRVGSVRACWLRLRLWIQWTNLVCERFLNDCQLIEQYAQATGMSARSIWRRVRSRKQAPRCILAIPIESFDNQRWGVLVLDNSNDIESVDTETPVFRRAFNRLKATLDRYGVTRT